MKKRINMLLLFVLVLALTACSKKNNLEDVDDTTEQQTEVFDRKTEESSDQSSKEVHALTEEQEKLVGMWESPEGCILAIRASRVPDRETGFPLDAIYIPISVLMQMIWIVRGG